MRHKCRQRLEQRQVCLLWRVPPLPASPSPTTCPSLNVDRCTNVKPRVVCLNPVDVPPARVEWHRVECRVVLAVVAISIIPKSKLRHNNRIHLRNNNKCNLPTQDSPPMDKGRADPVDLFRIHCWVVAPRRRVDRRPQRPARAAAVPPPGLLRAVVPRVQRHLPRRMWERVD